MAFWRNLLGLPERVDETRSIIAADLPWMEHVPFNIAPVEYPGSYLNEDPRRAMHLSSVFAAVRLLAQSVSTLPIKAYRHGGDVRMPMNTLPPLFNTMQSSGELVPWLFRCVTSLAFRGNAYGLIVSRDGFGFPTAIDWLDPGKVEPDLRPGENGWIYKGKAVPAEDILHIPLFPMPGSKCGVSPISAYAHAIGIGLHAQNYANDWFAGGGFPPGSFQNQEKVVPQEEADAIKARLVAAVRSHTPLVYGKDWKFEPISVPPEEAQFVQTMKMTTNQVASVYGIPPEMIGGESGNSMTYANVEQQQINFVMFTLRPWLVTLEHAFSAILPNRQYVKFNSDALVRADLKTRWEVHQIAKNIGVHSVDDIRALEDESPLPNGQGNQYGPVSQPAPNPNPAGEPAPLRRIQ